jgi:hypothetical protein
MKYTPVSKPSAIKVIQSLLAMFIAYQVVYLWIFYIIMILCIANNLHILWKWGKFKSLPKKNTEACIVDRRVKCNSSGKGGTSYTHYVTYKFKDMADKTFTFEEQVSQEVYNWVNIGMLLTVEYAITDPRFACRSLAKVKNRS